MKRYYVSSYIAYFFDLCANPTYHGKLIENGFVRNKTIQRAVNSLKNVSEDEKTKIENQFLIGFEFAGTFLNHYWFPKKHMLEKVEEFVEKFLRDNYVIGMQFRFHYLNETDDVDIFVKCAKKIEKRNAAIIGNKKVKWFVVTDKPEFIDRFADKFGDNTVISTADYGHFGFSTWDPDAYQRVVLDLEVLARCDEMILTGGSTFGFMAAIKKQYSPYIVEGLRNSQKCDKFTFHHPGRTQNGHGIFKR